VSCDDVDSCDASCLCLIEFAEVEMENLQERYVQVLRSYLQHTSPHNPGRLGDLLAHIPEVNISNYYCTSS
jgi:hypothetical protein